MPLLVPRVRPGIRGTPGECRANPILGNIYNFMFYVYILLSIKDNKFYIGCTKNLKRRILEHKRKKVKSTKDRLPLKLVCYEAYLSKTEALRREKFLKSSDGKKDLKRNSIFENWKLIIENLSSLERCLSG